MTDFPAAPSSLLPSSPEEALSTRTVLRVLAIVLVTIGTIVLVRLLWQPIAWVVVATFLAIALSGPVNLLARRMRRGIAITIVYVGLLLVPVALGALIVPAMINQGVDFVNRLPKYSQDVQRYVQKNDRLRKINNDFGITESLQKEANNAPSRIGEAAGTLRDLGSALLSSLFAGFTIAVLSLFMVASGRSWVDRFLDLRGGRERDTLKRALDRIGIAVGNYVGGAIVQATIAGLSSFVVLSILGVPFAAPLAILVALFDLLPLVGATIAAVFVGLVTLFNDFPTATIIWGIFSIGYQQFENYVIQPQIQKRAVELQPFVVLLSVLFGGTLFGIVGAILAIPTAATIQISAQEWLIYHRETRAHEARLRAGAAPVDSTG